MNGSFLFLHMQSFWTMFGTNNNSDEVSKWEYMESQTNDYEYPWLIVDIQQITTDTRNSMMDVRMLITIFTMIMDFHLSFRDASEYMGNNSEWFMIIYGYP